MRKKEMPTRDKLVSYNHAVAGHAGTMCDPDGHFFIKPCVQQEIDFYQTALRRHPEFADLMPLFMGSLRLEDPEHISLDALSASVVTENGLLQAAEETLASVVAEQVATAKEHAVTAAEEKPWVPNKQKKIKTNQSVVLENASGAFKKPNILDVKLGTRLWADDAPQEKKTRFDKIASETTHKNLGFRIAGMRVFRGDEPGKALDDEEYMVYNKDYGRETVQDHNVVEAFQRFVFNKRAGITEELGQAVSQAFLRDLKKVEDVLSRHESRMYSASLLFVFEGDGEALQEAIEANNAAVEEVEEQKRERVATRVDSGIAMADDDEDEDDDELDLDELPKIWSLKVIDFAHAQFTPGQGPDENVLKGVRSLIKIFEELAQ